MKTCLRANRREFTILNNGLMPSVEGKLTVSRSPTSCPI